MSPGLFILSCDDDFVTRARAQFCGRFNVVVAQSPEEVPPLAGKWPVQVALAHLTGQTLNGHSVVGLLKELQKCLPSAPIYGLVDPRSPVKLNGEAAEVVRECLDFPVDFERLEHLLDRHSQPDDGLAGFYAGLPHRALEGQSRSLITFTPSMFDMFDDLEVAAAHDVTVLLIGETGSGKTYLARMLHELSPRSHERCLTVACGTLPPDLIESELFGYVKGAFTGADGNKQGKFAAAEQGTLLLDEIDVLAPDQQAKLLRIIETGEYEPVGSNDTRVSKARLIVASNIDLEQLVEAKKFRMDLYYRLNTLKFHLPPLRDRPWDIEYLARKFAIEHSRSHQIELKQIDPDFLVALRQYQWPGNIRELENVIRRAVLYCRDGTLTPDDLTSSIRLAAKGLISAKGNGKRNHRWNGKSLTLESRMEEIERRIIEESLQRNNYHRTATAQELGISRVTLYNKMKRLDIANLG
jgi:DNA-binding NtrC family response regulator